MGNCVKDKSRDAGDVELWRSKFKAVDGQGRDNHAAVERLLALMDAMADLLDEGAEGGSFGLTERIRDAAVRIRRGDASGFDQFVFTYGKEGIDDVGGFSSRSTSDASSQVQANEQYRSFFQMSREALPIAQAFMTEPKRLIGLTGRLRRLWG